MGRLPLHRVSLKIGVRHHWSSTSSDVTHQVKDMVFRRLYADKTVSFIEIVLVLARIVL